MQEDKFKSFRIVGTDFDFARDCWVYRLEDGSIVRSFPGDARIPCGLEYREQNQWGANQLKDK